MKINERWFFYYGEMLLFGNLFLSGYLIGKESLYWIFFAAAGVFVYSELIYRASRGYHIPFYRFNARKKFNKGGK